VDILVGPQRPRWLDITVGLLLSSLVLFGSLYIIRLNNDSREQQLDNELAMQGQRVSTSRGCVACHTVDGSVGIGPSWKGMMGRTEVTVNGTPIVVDEAYFRESLKEPGRKQVAGYPNVMSRYFLEEDEIVALLEFARQLSQPE
jgi:cytochrome c oxidase subunit 2